MTYTKFSVKTGLAPDKKAEAPIYLLHPTIEPVCIPAEQKKQENHTKTTVIIPISQRTHRTKKRKSTVISMIAFLLCTGICFTFGYLLNYACKKDVIAPKLVCGLTYRLAYISSGGNAEAVTLEKKSSIKKQSPVSTQKITANAAVEAPLAKASPVIPAASDVKSNSVVESQTAPSEPVPVSSEKGEMKSESGSTAYPLIKQNLAKSSDKLSLSNETSFTPNIEALMNESIPAFASADTPLSIDKPLVLVLHTHGTESYLPTDSDYYSEDDPTRTQDTTRNVVRVGTELSNILNSYGIPTLHCEIMHDKDSYVTAYKNSMKTMQEYLQKYPSIKYVIDVHRDSIFKANKEQIKPYTVINGEPSAQILMVIGTSGGGAAHPNWEKNLGLALKLETTMNKTFPTLARPINLRNSRFNQNVSEGAFILEVGSCGNTMDEALTAVKMFAQCFAKTLNNK